MPFTGLDPAWRASFELAWEAFRAGSIPVGAVVADEAGNVIARGRNRIFEDDAPSERLLLNRCAHTLGIVKENGLPPASHVRPQVDRVVEPSTLLLGGRPAQRDKQAVVYLEAVVRALAHDSEVEIRLRGRVVGRMASDQRHRQRALVCERSDQPLCNRLCIERRVLRTHHATVAPLPAADFVTGLARRGTSRVPAPATLHCRKPAPLPPRVAPLASHTPS
jgi:hypothetical protein